MVKHQRVFHHSRSVPFTIFAKRVQCLSGYGCYFIILFSISKGPQFTQLFKSIILYSLIYTELLKKLTYLMFLYIFTSFIVRSA